MAELKIIDEGLYNSDIKAWDQKSTSHLKAALNQLSIRQTGKLYKSVKGKVKMHKGLIYRITKEIDRSGVFVEKGVGRGYPIESVKGNGQKIKSASGKGRVPKPWFNSTIDKDLSELADLVQKRWADAALNHIRIK